MQEIVTNLMLFVGLVFLALIIVLIYLNSNLFLSLRWKQNGEEQIPEMHEVIKYSSRVQKLDVITGISNEAEMSLDLEKITNAVSHNSSFHVILVDLTDIGAINKRHGFELGNLLLQHFAYSALMMMRKNERLYRMSFIEQPVGDDQWQEVFRQHAGGDRFLFMIDGIEAEAVELLLRLERCIINEVNPFIRSKILGSTNWSLSFFAAVAAIHANDTKESLLQRASEGIRIVRQPGRTCRVYWPSMTDPGALVDGRQQKIYDAALEAFSVNSA